MKKYILRLITLLTGIFILIPNIVQADRKYELVMPNPSWEWDLNEIIKSENIETDETELIDIINIINKYLRFSLAWIAMIIFVYAWFMLIVWWWKDNKDNFKKANNMLLISGIAIVISMLSYSIIKLVTNLF